MIKVFGIGRIAHDIELKTTASGKTVIEFQIGSKIGYGNNERIIFPTCVAWEKTAETIQKYFHKGDQIIIDGYMDESTYKRDDRTIKKTTIIINEFEFGAKKADTKTKQVNDNYDMPIVAEQEDEWLKQEGVKIGDDFINSDDLPFY